MKKKKKKEKENKMTSRDTFMLKLHPSEQKLIKTIRAIDQGEIESIKIQNGLPVIFRIPLSGESFGKGNRE
jgi:hypothetical protein